MSSFEPVIGLEIHAQLLTRTKIFCPCPTEFGAPPNTHVCPVCLGFPGALPVLNRAAVDYAVTAALAQLFAEDGFVLPSGKMPVRGRAAVEQYYTGQGGPLSLRAFAYATEGKVGYILGGYAGQKGAPDSGKFTLTLRKGPDKRWLIVSDMDNTNRQR